eukprot:PhM_4_TR11290/c3_g1_i1/m.93294
MGNIFELTIGANQRLPEGTHQDRSQGADQEDRQHALAENNVAVLNDVRAVLTRWLPRKEVGDLAAERGLRRRFAVPRKGTEERLLPREAREEAHDAQHAHSAPRKAHGERQQRLGQQRRLEQLREGRRGAHHGEQERLDQHVPEGADVVARRVLDLDHELVVGVAREQVVAHDGEREDADDAAAGVLVVVRRQRQADAAPDQHQRQVPLHVVVQRVVLQAVRHQHARGVVHDEGEQQPEQHAAHDLHGDHHQHQRQVSVLELGVEEHVEHEQAHGHVERRRRVQHRQHAALDAAPELLQDEAARYDERRRRPGEREAEQPAGRRVHAVQRVGHRKVACGFEHNGDGCHGQSNPGNASERLHVETQSCLQEDHRRADVLRQLQHHLGDAVGEAAGQRRPHRAPHQDADQRRQRRHRRQRAADDGRHGHRHDRVEEGAAGLARVALKDVVPHEPPQHEDDAAQEHHRHVEVNNVAIAHDEQLAALDEEHAPARALGHLVRARAAAERRVPVHHRRRLRVHVEGLRHLLALLQVVLDRVLLLLRQRRVHQALAVRPVLAVEAVV